MGLIEVARRQVQNHLRLSGGSWLLDAVFLDNASSEGVIQHQ